MSHPILIQNSTLSQIQKLRPAQLDETKPAKYHIFLQNNFLTMVQKRVDFMSCKVYPDDRDGEKMGLCGIWENGIP